MRDLLDFERGRNGARISYDTDNYLSGAIHTKDCLLRWGGEEAAWAAGALDQSSQHTAIARPSRSCLLRKAARVESQRLLAVHFSRRAP